MKKNLFCVLALAAAAIVACAPDNKEGLQIPEIPTGTTEDPNIVKITNSNFEDGLEGWEIKNYSNGTKAFVGVVEGEGVKDSKCLKVQQFPEDGKCCVGVERTLTGLEPDQMYRASVRIRYSDIPNGEGTGPVIFSPNNKQYWNSSKYLYGTELENWTNVVVDFMSNDFGEAKLTLALGYYQGGMANGGRSTGTGYFDNVSVRKVTDELFHLESEHMRIYFEPSKVTVPTTVMRKWIDNVDKIYEGMAELMGATPHEGRKLAIQTTQGIYSGYWALAGYPILWSIYPLTTDRVENSLAQIQEYDDMSFGLMHEVGHVFNIGNTSWNWNDEMFANFRMHYALEKSGLKVYQTDENNESKVYTGSEIINLYKVSYDKTVGTKVNDNGIHYMLARMAPQIGWESYKKTFDYLRKTGFSGSSNKYDKFVNFVNTLSRYATEVNGRTINCMDFFTESEIASIQKQLK